MKIRPAPPPRAPPRSSRTASLASVSLGFMSRFGRSVSVRGVRLALARSAAPQAGAQHGEEHRLAGCAVLEAVRQVGVECHAVTLRELVALPVAHQRDRAALDQRRLAAAGLVDRRVVVRAGDRSRRERVAGELARCPGPARVVSSKHRQAMPRRVREFRRKPCVQRSRLAHARTRPSLCQPPDSASRPAARHSCTRGVDMTSTLTWTPSRVRCASPSCHSGGRRCSATP